MTRKFLREHKYTVSVGVLTQLIRYLASKNINIDEFMKSVELESGIQSNPDERIPVEKYVIVEDAKVNIKM